MPQPHHPRLHSFGYGTHNVGTVSAALQGGMQLLQEGLDLQYYNYSLPYAFASAPEVSVAVQDFQMGASNNIFFYVKPILDSSTTSVLFVIRTQWCYTSWIMLSFNFIAEDRHDIRSGYHQIDSGSLTSFHSGATIQVAIPYRQRFPQSARNLVSNQFLHGFELSTSPINMYSSDATRTPFDIQLGNAKTFQ